VTANEEDRLFDQLGGVEGVEQIVRVMYDRVLHDPELAPFFENADLERLRRMQFQFVAAALGGPVVYSGPELRLAHGKVGVTNHAFAKFCGHLADAMEERGIGPNDVNAVMARLSMYKDPIVGQANVDG
jgi:hemoglobin